MFDRSFLIMLSLHFYKLVILSIRPSVPPHFLLSYLYCHISFPSFYFFYLHIPCHLLSYLHTPKPFFYYLNIYLGERKRQRRRESAGLETRLPHLWLAPVGTRQPRPPTCDTRPLPAGPNPQRYARP